MVRRSARLPGWLVSVRACPFEHQDDGFPFCAIPRSSVTLSTRRLGGTDPAGTPGTKKAVSLLQQSRLIRSLAILLACVLVVGARCHQDAEPTHPAVHWNNPPDSRTLKTSLLDVIDRADTSLDFAIYQFNDSAVAQALIQAHQEDVRVRIVSETDYVHKDGYKHVFTRLREVGIPVQTDEKSSHAHNKFMVVDGEAVWTGSTNVTTNGFNRNANNAVILESEAVARAYTQEFEEMFEGQFSNDKTDNTQHHFPHGSRTPEVEVYFSPTDGVRSEILEELAQADHTVSVAQFSFTSDSIAHALHRRADTGGLDVQVLMEASQSGGKYPRDDKLQNHGIPIHFDTYPGFLHHKFVIIDPGTPSNPTVITGSYNYSGNAEDRNDENIIILHDPAVAREYDELFETIWTEHSEPKPQGADTEGVET